MYIIKSLFKFKYLISKDKYLITFYEFTSGNINLNDRTFVYLKNQFIFTFL